MSGGNTRRCWVHRFQALMLLGCLVAVAGCGVSEQDRAFKGVTPELVAPQDGKVFDNHPRYAYLQWKPVAGVRRYLVEIELGLADGTWIPGPPDINRRFVNENHVQILFTGAQPGRWRVVAVNENSVQSEPSEWWHFEFTR